MDHKEKLFGSWNAADHNIVGTLQFDAATDGWSGQFKVELFDASGQVTFTDRGTHTLTRIAVESLY